MKIGLIGAGNMAGALAAGIIKSGVVNPDDVFMNDVNPDRLTFLKAQYGIVPFTDCADMIAQADMIVLAVKPNVLDGVLHDQGAQMAGKAIVSFVTGWTTAALTARLPADARVLRVMPNTPALCGVGMAAFSDQCTLTQEERSFAEKMFLSVGRLSWVHENQMEAVTGVSGSGPAYAYMFIEAMADGGVACGLTRAQALEMAAQTVKGAAEMVLATGRHPGELKDAVCSPGGTTIQSVRTLEKMGMRSAVIEAVMAAAEQAARMQV